MDTSRFAGIGKLETKNGVGGMLVRHLRRLISSLAVALGLTFTLAAAAAAQTQASQQTQTTASFKVSVQVGPLETMLMPDQAAGAKDGEVMVQMPGMPMPSMSTTDQGQPVNHHLEAHIYNKTNGAVLNNVAPTLTVTNQASGSSRKIDPVMAMYGVTAGQSDLHYGGNVYLPNGTYTVTVAIGSEMAVFKDMAVSAAVAAPAQAPASSMPMPTQLPKTGGGALDARPWSAPGLTLAFVILAAAAALACAAVKRLRA